MYKFQLIIRMFVIGLLITKIATTSSNSDAGLTTPQIITKYGYPVESHQVKTEDGYFLTLFRIPHGLNQTYTEGKPPVLLMHGVYCTSSVWLNSGPKKALAFLLADVGFDVWLGNQRGNLYSRNHTIYDPKIDAAKYFDYSFHEIAIYDLPAKIDFILNVTKKESLLFAGHSQGFTAALVLVIEKPEYNRKFRQISGLSPIAYMKNCRSPLYVFLAKNIFLFKLLTKLFQIHELFSNVKENNEFKMKACSDGSPFQEICANILFSIGGFDSEELDRHLLSAVFYDIPGAASVRELSHYFQEINSGEFRQYDYGYLQNKIKYGTFTPPSYDLSKVTAHVTLHYGSNDWLATYLDVEKLGGKLSNVTMSLNARPKFMHFDFLWSINIVDLINKDVVEEMIALK